MTKASLTEMQAMVSTPFALNLSASATKPGTCLAEQVGVKAPGSAKATTFLPGAKSSSVVTGLGPSGPIVRSVALGTLSPTLAISLTPPELGRRTLGKRQVVVHASLGVLISGRSFRKVSEMLQHILRRRRFERARLLDEQFLDDATVDDHGVALAARAETVLRGIERQTHRLRELGIAVAQHQDLVAYFLVLAPGAHDERVVDRNARYRDRKSTRLNS